MTDDTRTPQEIEREIETQRAELTSNLEGLQDKFSIDTLVRQVGDHFREHGGDMGRSIADQVKANPIPLALTGIGLAWMMFGNSRITSSSGFSRAGDEYRQTRHDQNRPYTPPVASYPPQRARPSWASDDHCGSALPLTSDGLSASARRLEGSSSHIAGADRRGTAGSSIADSASKAASTVGDAASSATSTLAGGFQSVQGGLAEAGSRIAEGTETLSEEGRKRVIAARQKALEIRRSTAETVTQGTDAAADFYERQPLVFGALALAVGAALGGALPRTRAEDSVMGDQSDMIFDEAERIFEEEMAKAAKLAETVKDELGEAVSTTKASLKRDQKADAQTGDAKEQSPGDRVSETRNKDEGLEPRLHDAGNPERTSK
jgi:hypothetical protein